MNIEEQAQWAEIRESAGQKDALLAALAAHEMLELYFGAFPDDFKHQINMCMEDLKIVIYDLHNHNKGGLPPTTRKNGVSTVNDNPGSNNVSTQIT